MVAAPAAGPGPGPRLAGPHRPRPAFRLRPQVRRQLPAHSPRDTGQEKGSLMTPPANITGILLIAVVVLQMRVRTLILRSLLLPPGLVAGAGSGSGLAEGPAVSLRRDPRSEEHTSELQSPMYLV